MGDVSAAPPPVTAQSVRELLAMRYQPPEWRLEYELTLNTRRLDAVALCMWGGSGRAYQVLGFEIKVSRADWLRELASIDKATEWAQVVDRFFVVAPRGVVRDGELPRDWGLLELTGTGNALRIKAHPAPRPIGATLPRELTSRLLTRDHYERKKLESEATSTAQAEGEARARKAIAAELEALQLIAKEHHQLLREAGLARYADPVRALQTAHRVADALAKLEEEPFRWTIDRITKLAADTAAHAQQLQDAVAEFRAPLTAPSPQSGITT